MNATRGCKAMRTMRITTLLLLVGSLFAVGAARSQEPPPYPGGDAAQAPGPQDAGAPPAPDNQGAQGAPEDPAAASVDYFHQQLSPYGQWVEREGYGMVWVPSVPAGWRPYTTGHWAYTDQGWAWVADEPWGWAPFHYGRWYYDAEIGGWGWVPGTVWAPAWVAWRHGGGYLGWAPLSPEVGFRAGFGLEFGRVVISPGFFTFVGERDILAPRVSAVILPSARNVTIVRTAVNVTNYTVVNNRIVNNGVSVARIEQVTGHPVARLQVAAMASGGPGGRGAFYQPAVVARAASVPHPEFGAALKTQVAVQQKSRAFAQVHADTASGVATGRRQHGAVNAPRANGNGTPAGAGSPRYNVGIDGTKKGGPTGQAQPPAGGKATTAGGKVPTGGQPPAGGKPQVQEKKAPPKTPPPPKEEKEHKPPPV